jgi:uncharacterized protein (DUF1800 family)
MENRVAHALIRFGLGGRADALPADPMPWLRAQLDGADPRVAANGLADLAEGLTVIRAEQRNNADEVARQRIREIFRSGNLAAADGLISSEQPFRERLVWFWANHFTVSIRRFAVTAVGHHYIREAIRPHVTGNFAEMLRAVMRHPAMLMYLDNQQSFGPNSQLGLRQKRGLNENLARECLELHTVTPAAGYTQADVTEFARVLTGWSIAYEQPPFNFVFRPGAHEPGAKRVMGQEFAPGEAGGLAALDWLAGHPATHHSLATKLVRHFVADDPPPDAVRRIEGVLRDSKGDLKAASLALLDLPQAWVPLTKLRTPVEFVIAAVRAMGLPADKRPDVPGVLNGLGQPFLNAPLPNGWADTAADWAGPEGMLRRMEWGYGLAGRVGGLNPVEIAEATLGPLLPADTKLQIARAGSRREGMTLLFAAPEFQRR